MEKYLIRTDIMNLNRDQWVKVQELETVGFIEMTVKEFHDIIGFSGGMFLTGKANESEKQFIDEFYIYGRNEKLNMLVICEGHKNCEENCAHKKIHQHIPSKYDNDTFSCSTMCCDKLPFHCTHECYNLYMRKRKLKKIEDVSNL